MPFYVAVLPIILVALSVSAVAADPSLPTGQKGVYTVTDFGAKGDGKTDDTAAFQKALDAAGADGGGIVFAPTGEYLIKSHLVFPKLVTLEGVFRAPTASEQGKGTTLLAVEGKGSEDGHPFILLHRDSTVKGLIIYYPEQDRVNPVPYPWCIRGRDDNNSIVDVQLINPWQAVDFGTNPCGRHYIKGLYAQPIKTGIFVDKCLDVGRIEDVHLWPFWDIPLMKDGYTSKHGTGFIFGRTDWEFVSGCFCIFFKVGFRFTAFNDGPGNVVINNSGSDLGPCAVLVEKSQGHAGIVFTNAQLMSTVEVKDTNAGPVKFNNCGFWAVQDTTNQARVAGHGHVSFIGCHFTSWDQAGKGAPAIFADGRAVTVSNCDFMEAGKNQITLGENSQAAIIMGNLMRGGIKVDNKSKGKVEMGLNIGD